ncbi:uncharacterized protein LOC120322279 [Drosophila yakuba]|uniref:uncharacterized protein LOC120322278 n=1 Tax=Drosophila yakuba TaxID=7245 RepID=UPI00193081CA|nr:uncharacterized protein LOC120322278 [Drosophila yakuba]XP_039233272.1 uncharacterized protein LOC120322279 [Drosophila yakuba]
MPTVRSTHTNTTKAAQTAKQTATNENEKPAIQTEMDRYIQIKRKLSPQKNVNKPKITRANANTTLGEVPNNVNRFDILADTIEDLAVEADGSDKNKPKPPPIFVREKSSSTFVNNVIKLIGDANFHIISLVRGNIHETKVQTKSEQHLRALTKSLDEGEKSYYTYQLKSSAPKKDSSRKKCGNFGGNHTANYRGCPVYQDLKSRINQRVTTVRSQNAPITKIPSKNNPEVFFSTAPRSSLGTGFVTKNESYASALRSGLEPPASNAPCSQAKYVDFNSVQDKKPMEQQQNNFEAMILTLQQSMAEFMAFMRTTIQDLLRNKNMLIQLLVSQQSK